jgi:hypothetical protein
MGTKIRFVMVEADDVSSETIGEILKIIAASQRGPGSAPVLPSPQPEPVIPALVETAVEEEEPAASPVPVSRPRQLQQRAIKDGMAIAPSKRGARRVMCDEKPGETFTLDEAEKLCGVGRASIGQCCAPSNQRAGRTSAGGFHWHWAGDNSPTPPPRTRESRNPAAFAIGSSAHQSQCRWRRGAHHARRAADAGAYRG